MVGPALVQFNRDQPTGIVRTVRRLESHVSEIRIVDSSSPANYRALVEALRGTRAEVVRAPPVGCTELLRPLAHAGLDSPWVLSIDADEDASESLMRRLGAPPDGQAAFRIAREETSLGTVTWHTRLYRRDRIRYEGWIHEDPRVEGSVARFAPSECLVHTADYAGYLAPEGRGTSYLRTESYERPFTGESLRTEFPGSRFVRLGGQEPGPWSPALTWLFLASRAVAARSVRATPTGPRLQHRLYQKYLRARARSFYGMSPPERREAATISNELRGSGGPIRYLGFDDLSRVRHLAERPPVGISPGDLLCALLTYRHRAGRPADDWPPTGSELAPVFVDPRSNSDPRGSASGPPGREEDW